MSLLVGRIIKNAFSNTFQLIIFQPKLPIMFQSRPETNYPFCTISAITWKPFHTVFHSRDCIKEADKKGLFVVGIFLHLIKLMHSLFELWTLCYSATIADL